MNKLKSIIKEALQTPDNNQRGNIKASLNKISKNIDFSQIKTNSEEVANWFIANKNNIEKSSITSMAGDTAFYIITKDTPPKIIILAFGDSFSIHRALSIIKSRLPKVPKYKSPNLGVQYVNR